MYSSTVWRLEIRTHSRVAPMRHPVLPSLSLSLSLLLSPSLFFPKLSRARLVRFTHPRVNIEPSVLMAVYIDYIGCPGTVRECAFNGRK